LRITDPVCGMSSSFPVNVIVNEKPVVKALKSNDIDCQTGTSQLNATGARSYEWLPAAATVDSHIADPMVAIESTTTFTVTGMDENGCTSTDTVTVLVTSKGKALMVLPNAFTPNHDGLNDCFGVIKWGNVTIEEFSIFNRWGQRVFDTRNAGDCWDGTFHGEMQDTGQYVYVIKAASFCGNITRTGTVLLIR
ncbi:MAG TPA: gliding motility-associated C-terminal domain-containing protein, partial [Puia sp.]